MGFLDVLTKPRRIPSFLLGVLCLGAALIQVWLALGPSENLPTDSREMEAAIQETRSVVQESQDLLKQIQEAGSDRQATQRLFEQMNQQNEKWKRQQEDRQARLSGSSRRKRLGFAAMATIFMLIAVRFLVESVRGKTRRENTASGEGQEHYREKIGVLEGMDQQHVPKVSTTSDYRKSQQMGVLAFLSKLRQRTQTALAERSFSALGELLTSLHIPEASELADIHFAQRDTLTQFFGEHAGLSKSILFVYKRVVCTVSSFDDMLDPTISADMANLASLCLDEYPSAFRELDTSTRVRNLLENILGVCISRVASRASSQINVLARAVAEVIQFLSQFSIQQSRIILLELPVGNSIPTKLLRHFLHERGYKVELVRVSLSRNDKANRGLTRDALLEDALGRVTIQANDILIYIDEWLTGTNFNRINTIVSRRLPSGSFFLPVALLTSESEHHDRYEKQFRPAHDQLLKQMGVEGSRFRFTFPCLQSKLVRFGYFFWSEHDRTAGYRKMQFLGSMFSTIDAAIEDMHTKPEVLLRAKISFLKLAAEDGGSEEAERISKSVILNHKAFTEIFNESYEDYRQCRPAIEKLDLLSNVNDVSDADEALRQVNEAVFAITKGRNAQICVNLAVALGTESEDIDPKDRFYFPHHVPVIIELEGNKRRLHEIWMDLLSGEIKRLL